MVKFDGTRKINIPAKYYLMEYIKDDFIRNIYNLIKL